MDLFTTDDQSKNSDSSGSNYAGNNGNSNGNYESNSGSDGGASNSASPSTNVYRRQGRHPDHGLSRILDRFETQPPPPLPAPQPLPAATSAPAPAAAPFAAPAPSYDQRNSEDFHEYNDILDDLGRRNNNIRATDPLFL